MACGKVPLIVLMFVVLVLTGCGQGTRKNVVNAKDDVTCVRRTDLRLVVGALTRDVDMMENALKSGANVDVIVEGLGPPITVSALVDNYKAVQLLLDKGANINAADPQGSTALIHACLLNHKDIAELLVSRGADVNLSSDLTGVKGEKKGTFTPLMIAKYKGHQEIVKLLTAAGAKE